MTLIRRAGLITATAAAGLLVGSAAQASTPWGGLRDYYGGNLVASGSGSYAETSTQETQLTNWEDRRADGHGAYVRANFEGFAYTCYPDPALCHWEWSTGTQKKTPELGSADGVRTTTLTATRSWPTNRDQADVCIDVSLRPDPCVSTPYLYP